MTERGYRERDKQPVVDELLERVHQLEDANRALADENRALREPPVTPVSPRWNIRATARVLLQLGSIVFGLLVVAAILDVDPTMVAVWSLLAIVCGVGSLAFDRGQR